MYSGDTERETVRSGTLSVRIATPEGSLTTKKEATGIATLPDAISTRKEVFVKWGVGKLEWELLNHEALFYMLHLYDLQGLIVPRFLGYYEGHINGKPAAFSVFEHDKISHNHEEIDP